MGDLYLNRDVKDSWLYADYQVFSKWLSLVLLAHHEPTKILISGRLHHVPQGCVAIELKDLAKMWNTKKGNVYHFLSLLEEDDLATVGRVGRIIFINIESRYVRMD